MSDELFLGCTRYGEALNPPVGSSVDVCARCRELVHVAPSSRQIMKQRPEIVIRCLQCLAETAPPGDYEIAAHPSQHGELIKRGIDPATKVRFRKRAPQ